MTRELYGGQITKGIANSAEGLLAVSVCLYSQWFKNGLNRNAVSCWHSALLVSVKDYCSYFTTLASGLKLRAYAIQCSADVPGFANAQDTEERSRRTRH